MATGEGKLFILYGPSGSGKSTLLAHVLQTMPSNFEQVITYTTRAARAQEADGKDYYFISRDTFITKMNEGFFIHTTRYVDNYYGASKDVLDKLASDNNLIAIFDRTGAQEVKDAIPESVLVWITASLDELKERLAVRYESDPALYASRVARLEEDMLVEKASPLYDYHIVNSNLDHACRELEEIIQKELPV